MAQKGDSHHFGARGHLGAVQDTTATLVSGLYHDCSEGDGVTLMSFCHLLAHQRLLSLDFDHKSMLETFKQHSGGPLYPEEPLDSRLLDSKQFRQALQALANEHYGAQWGLKKAGADSLDRQTTESESRRPSASASGVERRGSRLFAAESTNKISALQDLLRDVSLRNSEIPFNIKTVSPMRTALFDDEVIQAAYNYENAFRKLFLHYATSDRSPSGGVTLTLEERADKGITARSLYRLARATRLIPDCLVPGEFQDVVNGLRFQSAARAAENRFFQEGRMLQREEEPKWHMPAEGMLTGEPRFFFPEMLEILAAASFHTPPRLYAEPVQDRIERIHDIFGDLLQLPREEDGRAFRVDLYLKATTGFHDTQELAEDLEISPQSLDEVMQAIDAELPLLAERKDPHIPKPPAHVVDKLPVQPMTADERIDDMQRRNPLGKTAAGGKKKGKKAKGAKQPKKRELFYGKLPVKWNQVQWLGKRPEPPKVVIPPMWQTDSKAAMLRNLDEHILQEREESRALNTPSTGWVLRLQLIDEPLRAPVCSKSEEVTTLMEAASASRRLRQYDSAMALLIRARQLWVAVEARQPRAAEWEDVQALVPTPSPWNSSADSASPMQRWAVAADTGSLEDQAELDRTIFPDDLGRRHSKGMSFGRSRTETLSRDIRAGEQIHRSMTDRLGRTSPESDDRAMPHAPLDSLERRRQRMASRGSFQQSDAPQSARGRSPTSRADTRSPGATRKYNPKTDFASALGDQEDLERIPPQAALFFFCELASLHSAVQEDELSAQLLWRALEHSRRLPAQDANSAMVWNGLGRVAFHIGRFEDATRLHMRARSIREKALGGDTIDTATSYNNLACCLAALDRHTEAAAFTELAVEILKELAGEDHPRTLTASRNLAKVRTAPKKMSLEAPHLFSLPLHDFTAALRGRRKKKKKKSRSGSSKSSKSRK